MNKLKTCPFCVVVKKMKDKEKQIEEMAKEMSKELCCYYDKQKKKCTNCFGMEEDCDLHCNFGRTLERLSKAGYRKLPENSVVLSKEEYENIYEEAEQNVLANIADGGTSCHWCIEQHEKKTAEKIYLQAKAIVDNTKYLIQGREYLHIDALKELVKAVGVEFKE